jgi:hypothetical protein
VRNRLCNAYSRARKFLEVVYCQKIMKFSLKIVGFTQYLILTKYCNKLPFHV